MVPSPNGFVLVLVHRDEPSVPFSDDWSDGEYDPNNGEVRDWAEVAGNNDEVSLFRNQKYLSDKQS